ncbi:hypothetical protein H310_06041 [Aphanomyces invadans]|uniref:Uncharacterized protein n=1 Tax=Aphanomyces invadans TaxID=157072 RepID=A0A024U8G3_9STRA|nr:hypothetical protein H310_06041 [Aphanomyces invadans]ETW02559.1 hypothetical protein H310_06041 [Aphanomyces invadans]|eukprot:XP_008869164.1 hypothetical protein H310_06041 [Aphanomyces invadans]
MLWRNGVKFQHLHNFLTCLNRATWSLPSRNPLRQSPRHDDVPDDHCVLNTGTIVVGKTRVLGDHRSIMVELEMGSQATTRRFIVESDMYGTYLTRFVPTDEVQVFYIKGPVRWSVWPSHAAPPVEAAGAIPVNSCLSTSATVTCREGTFVRVQGSSHWLCLDPASMEKLALETVSRTYLLSTEATQRANACVCFSHALSTLPLRSIVKTKRILAGVEPTTVLTVDDTWVSLPHRSTHRPKSVPPAGRLIQLCLQENVYVVVLNEVHEDGDALSQFHVTSHVPDALTRELDACRASGQPIERVALGADGAWYLSYMTRAGRVKRCSSNTLIAAYRDLHIRGIKRARDSVVREYQGNPELIQALTKPLQGYGDVVAVRCTERRSFVVLFDYTFVASPDIPELLTATLQQFYDKHGKLRQNRDRLIAKFHRVRRES